MDNTLITSIEAHQITNADEITNIFNPLFLSAKNLENEVKSIVVTSVDDKENMAKARELRLTLKNIRVNTENKRKELKEESLRKSKAIDGVANVIKFLIEPLEKHLEDQEKFAELAEAKRLSDLKVKRESELLAYEVDVQYIKIEDMDEEVYQNYLVKSESDYGARKEAERKAEEERVILAKKAEVLGERKLQAAKLGDFFTLDLNLDTTEVKFNTAIEEATKAKKDKEIEIENIKKANKELVLAAEENRKREREEKLAQEKALKLANEEKEKAEKALQDQKDVEFKAKFEEQVKKQQELDLAKKAEKNKKFQKWLMENKFNPATDKWIQDGNSFTLTRVISTITIL